MRELVDAYKGLLLEAAQGNDDLARTASFALDQVDWSQELMQTAAVTNPILHDNIAQVCENSGCEGSATNRLTKALLPVVDQLSWRRRDIEGETASDMLLLYEKFTAVTIVGQTGLISCDKIIAGFSLQAPDAYYPPHEHLAEESYWIIGGGGDWKVDRKPWFPVNAGDAIYHTGGARHVMQTNEQPMLSIWLWTSHLDSDVVITRA